MIILTRAPGRIPLGGGGTDLPSYYKRYGGFLISIAINKYTYIMINKTTVDNLIRLKYSQSEIVENINMIKHIGFRETLNFMGIKSGIEIATMTDAPLGTGLGSSGSFTVALLTALHAFKRQQTNAINIAQEACEIEINRAGMATGKQDQYLAALGGIVCLEFKNNGEVNIIPVKIHTYTLEKLKANLLLFYTGISRESFKIQSDQIRNTEEDVQEVIESLNITKEIGMKIKNVLERGDLDRFGELLDFHWENKKKRSKKISNPQIDKWYRTAKENGALGGKIMGAGGGGFFAFYCPDETKNNVREALVTNGLKEMDYQFDTEGAKLLVNI
jgi:D-glycero-alpha-D-manno-heptose-7-phosphate kinase